MFLSSDLLAESHAVLSGKYYFQYLFCCVTVDIILGAGQVKKMAIFARSHEPGTSLLNHDNCSETCCFIWKTYSIVAKVSIWQEPQWVSQSLWVRPCYKLWSGLALTCPLWSCGSLKNSHVVTLQPTYPFLLTLFAAKMILPLFCLISYLIPHLKCFPKEKKFT